MAPISTSSSMPSAKLFGTDGIRAQANTQPMTAELMLQLGKALGQRIQLTQTMQTVKLSRSSSQALSQASSKSASKPAPNSASKQKQIKVIIGKDTRLSGYVFEFALTSGLCSIGCNVLLVGPMPTPAVAHLTKSFAADAGVVISASHNPYSDNGVKVFDSKGFKITYDEEKAIESLIAAGPISSGYVKGSSIGKASRIFDAAGRYVEYAKASIGNRSLADIKLVIDCANGAAYQIATEVFSELGAEVIVLNKNPDGININDNCGALHPEVIQKAVLQNNADAGIAFDGDADRVIMADEKGHIVDGDKIMLLLAEHMKKKGVLTKNAVVATVMSNLGFEKALSRLGIKLIRTDVGDKNVIDEMLKSGCVIGGEKSGHIILSDYCTTGDGIIASLNVLNVMAETKRPLSSLGLFNEAPHILLNVPVAHKKSIEQVPELNSAVKSAQKELRENGRVLVRYSGTENVLRIFIEGNSKEKIKQLANSIHSAAKKIVE